MSPITAQVARLRAARARRGLSLPEALISLAICSSLLVAMGTAFRATAQAMTANDEFARATQAARCAVVRLEKEIRRGTLDSTVTLDGSGNTTTLRLISAEGGAANTLDRSYTYNSTAKKLYLVTNSITTDADVALCSNVSSAFFHVTKGTDSAGAACVSQVSVTITVTVGKNSMTLSGSAAPRKSLAN